MRRIEGEDSGRAQSGERRGRARGGAAGEARDSEEGAEENEERQLELCSLLPLRFCCFDLCCFDQGAEDGAGGFVVIDRALGMPLHREHEMIGGSAFQRFDDAVVGAAGDDAQAVADLSRRIGDAKSSRGARVCPSVFVPVHDFCQLRIFLNLDCVCDRYLLSGFVIDSRAQVFRQKIRDVLD